MYVYNDFNDNLGPLLRQNMLFLFLLLSDLFMVYLNHQPSTLQQSTLTLYNYLLIRHLFDRLIYGLHFVICPGNRFNIHTILVLQFVLRTLYKILICLTYCSSTSSFVFILQYALKLFFSPKTFINIFLSKSYCSK